MNLNIGNEPKVATLSADQKVILLLDKIREKVLANPESLTMDYWHSDCGTTHCLAGWAETLTYGTTRTSGTRDIGSALLGDFKHLFYASKDIIFNWLKGRAYALQHGKVVKVGNLWFDRNCNTYNGKLTQTRAEKIAATNKGCWLCLDCKNCVECIKSTNCVGCSNANLCLDCRNCQIVNNCNNSKNCRSCSSCSDCNDCSNCSICSYCKDCKFCSDCKNCNDCTDCSNCDSCTECVRTNKGYELLMQKS